MSRDSVLEWGKGDRDSAISEAEAYRDRVQRRQAGEDVGPPAKLKRMRRPPKRSGRRHLVIGDSHSNPDVPNHRYEWLGKFIADIKPDVVIDIGDWWSMDSLSGYDKRGSKSFEGARYWRDIDAGVDAMERVQHYTKGLSKSPRWIRTLGNHENRINRIIEEEPRWEGVVGTHDLHSEMFGWEEHPFLEPVEAEGVTYSHYFVSGVMGRAISGEHPGAAIIRKHFKTCIAGHSHLFAYSERTSIDGSRIIGMQAGCYLHHDEDYAGIQASKLWRRGLLILDDVDGGTFDHRWVSIERIAQDYG